MNKIEINVDNLPEDISIIDLIYLYKYNKDKKYVVGSVQTFNDLEDKKYVKWTDDDSIVIRQKGLDLLEDENIIREIKEEDPVKTLINKKNDIEEWIEEYRNMFKDTGPGKTADVKTLIKKMSWFYKEYPELADKDLILKATERYVSAESLSSYRYLQRADYFISKEDTSRIKISRLASYCQDMLDEEVDFDDENSLL